MNLPQEFILNIEKLFAKPQEAVDFFAALAQPRQYGIRANGLKVSARDFAVLSGGPLPIPWCKEGFYYEGEAPPSRNPLYYAGLYYIQEPSAMSAAAVLDVQRGDKVLDLCASPGGKSTQIAVALGGAGLLVANDVNYGRMPQLVRNIEMAGVKNAIILCEAPARLAARFPAYFDKILVDAPCSGEGMFRKEPAAVRAWDKNKAARLAAIQKEILRNGAKMLAPGGSLVYSTCTFSPVENEDVIEDFLRGHPDFESVCINHDDLGVSPANLGLTTANGRAARIWPHRQRGEGHFAALLRRGRGGTLPPVIKGYKAVKFDMGLFDDFCDRHMVSRRGGQILEHRGNLYALPDICPDVTGLNIVRMGLKLGALKKGRFEPSYALAMAHTMSDFVESINMDIADPRIWDYLGGHSFDLPAADGLHLLCAAGWPLGFAKVLKGRLKGRIIS